MYLKKISLLNFKNIEQAELALCRGVNCLVGDNGAGKTNVIAVEVPDRSGGLASVLKVVHEVGLNVEYMYAFVNKSGANAVLIFRFDEMDKAIEVLQSKGFTLLTGEQICSV